MSLVAAIVLFNILILIYIILIEIFTAMCRLTGISYEKARFQVISLLTGTGFTTAESEGMLVTKKRRKLAQNIMLFSYIFNISIVSIFVNVFMSTSNTTANEIKIAILLTMWNIVLMIFLRKSRIVKNLIDNLASKIFDYRMKKKENYISIYDTFGNKIIAEVELRHLRRDLVGKTIEELQLKNKYNIQLLVIKRKEEIISQIGPDTIIQEGDTIVVFGRLKDIKTVFVKMLDKDIINNKEKNAKI